MAVCVASMSNNGVMTVDKIEQSDHHQEAWNKVKKQLRAKIGEEMFTAWLARAELDAVDDGVLYISQPTLFLKNWTRTHYRDLMLQCCAREFPQVREIEVAMRQPVSAASRRKSLESAGETIIREASPGAPASPAVMRQTATGKPSHGTEQSDGAQGTGSGFSGSPLDRRYTFENFVVGQSNRLAHAAAKEIAETALERPRFNPLYIHSSVGLGKTHLLHAIAWEVKRQHPQALVRYLTAEHFRYRYVEAVRSQDANAFKAWLRAIDLLMIDDMEFLQGARTEQEFDHTLNALLDGGKQVVVASSRAPMLLDSLDARMRSRLVGGLVTEIAPLDPELRLRILERRLAERQASDPSFHVDHAVLTFLAERLTESGRELDGAITKLYASCHLTGAPVTMESAEKIIADLMRGMEPRRIKIDDILRVVSKHYGVSRSDILSQRRQRAIVHPRQIGMYLAKSLTSRSLPEIGRRFGNRDHTTVLHAIRKIEREIEGDKQLKLEIEDLKRLLHS